MPDDIPPRGRRRRRKRPPSHSLAVRRVLATALAALLLTAAVLGDTAMKESFDRDGRLVQTQPHRTGTVVEVTHAGRGMDTYTVEVNGELNELDYGWLLPDETPGARFQFVVDPEDGAHLIAVGSPDDWQLHPLEGILATGLILLVAGGISVWAAAKILPEDLERLTHRLF